MLQQEDVAKKQYVWKWLAFAELNQSSHNSNDVEDKVFTLLELTDMKMEIQVIMQTKTSADDGSWRKNYKLGRGSKYGVTKIRFIQAIQRMERYIIRKHTIL